MTLDTVKVKKTLEDAVDTLLEKADLKPGDVVIVGCSTSEIIGKAIGSDPSEEAAKAVYDAIYPKLLEKGIFMAAQCCEHLNRAVVVTKECADKYGYEQVTVIPVRKAGGSWATCVYNNMKDAIVVENIDKHKASAGIDIGEVYIGMHLKPVGVVVRPEEKWVGDARLTMIRTRPKLIGGERAQYK